ncbi:hypothetical protein P9112_004421 [Eukaryota sp. TZLM1-RC]
MTVNQTPPTKRIREEVNNVSDSELPVVLSPLSGYQRWNGYRLFSEQNGKRHCLLCPGMSTSFSVSTSQTVLKRHLEKEHPNWTSSIRQQQPTLKLSSFTPLPATVLSSAEVETGRKLLLKMFIQSGAPYSLADNPHFRNLMNFYNENTVIMSSWSISRSIRNAFSEMRPSMLQRLGQNRHSYSLTLDLWTSRAKRPYLGITAHFVSDDFNLSSLTLDVNSDNAELLAITSDNAANVRKALKLFTEKQPKLFHKKCMAHILNLVVKKGLVVVDGLLSKIHNFVRQCHVSSKLYQLLWEELQEQGLQKKTIPLDTAIRWNSTYLMVNTYMKIKSAVTKILVEEGMTALIVTEEEELKIEAILNLLAPFYECTVYLSAALHPTCGLVLMLIDGLYAHLYSYQNEAQIIQEAASLMLGKLEQYLEELYDFPAFVSSILDPRWQIDSLPSWNPFLRRSHAEGDELSTFLSEAPVDLSVNPLQWWNDNKRRFPVLSQIAADFLAIQPTSVPCERLFSLAGDMVSEKRCCLADDSVRAVLCLRSWLENGFDLI